MQLVKELEIVTIATDRFPKRRLVILRREGGSYAFAEQYHFVSMHNGEVVAEGWNALPVHGFYASADMAEIEAKSSIFQLKYRDRAMPCCNGKSWE